MRGCAGNVGNPVSKPHKCPTIPQCDSDPDHSDLNTIGIRWSSINFDAALDIRRLFCEIHRLRSLLRQLVAVCPPMEDEFPDPPEVTALYAEINDAIHGR